MNTTSDIIEQDTSSGRDIYTVSRLNQEVRHLLEGEFGLLWVEGEISNFVKPASGHMYLSLKDRNAQVRCAMFKGRNALLRFAPERNPETAHCVVPTKN
jgi:exodeoxyribonuclease VII large subunit